MDEFMQVAQWRWLKPHEVWQCLSQWDPVREICSYPGLPGSGMLCFVRKSQFKSWKKDGHTYRKRKSEHGVREDRDKYTHAGETIQCVYTHGAGYCPKCSGQSASSLCPRCGFSGVTPSSFHRRAYWKVAVPELILVHYLDEHEETSSEEETQGSYSDTHSTAGTEEGTLQLIDIVDYSPEWDSVDGGAKILICIDPPLGARSEVQCVFGSSVSVGCLIQSGVVRCYAPAHAPGHVDFYLTQSGRDITKSRRSFEFRDHSRKRANASESANWWDLSEQEFKVRIVERLETLSKNADSTDPDIASEDLFENMIVGLVKKLIKLKAPVNQLDGFGFALIHYLAAVNYWRALQVFEHANCSVHVASKNGLTALDIAQHFHHHNSISVLLMCEADQKADAGDEQSQHLQDLLKAEKSFMEELQARETDAAFVQKVQTIQKNVRMWAIRRHYCGIKNATLTLQRYIRSLIVRKQYKDQRKAAITIQKTVRNWLQSQHFGP